MSKIPDAKWNKKRMTAFVSVTSGAFRIRPFGSRFRLSSADDGAFGAHALTMPCRFVKEASRPRVTESRARREWLRFRNI